MPCLIAEDKLPTTAMAPTPRNRQIIKIQNPCRPERNSLYANLAGGQQHAGL